MLIEVTVPYLPCVGALGTRVDIPEKEARVLILLNKARIPDETATRATRRVYQRRDMTAEGSDAPTVATPAPKAARAAHGTPTVRARRPRKITVAPESEE